jgi:DNA-binding XRE family transcriptional regulator
MKRIIAERMLLSLAKRIRKKTGKSKAAVAREFGVSLVTIHNAEETPSMSLTKMRIRMIEKYSRLKVKGPVYLLEER